MLHLINMKQTEEKLIERLKSVKDLTPESIYEKLTGREPKVYSLPLSSLFGSSFINLDRLLIKSVNEDVNLENQIKTEIQRIIDKYKDRIAISSLLDNVPPDDQQILSNLISKVYDAKEFFTMFRNGYLFNYDLSGKLMRVIDQEGDLYEVWLDRNYIQQEIKGLRLEPQFNPPKDLPYSDSVYGSKYGILIIELGACKHILIPDVLSPYCKIGNEPKGPDFPDESDEEFKKFLSKSKFILVPNKTHCPQLLEYNNNTSKLEWKTGASSFKMKLYFPKK